MLALSCPRPRPNALPGPVGPGRAWGGAGQNYLPLFVSVLLSHLLAYIWRWSRYPGRCHQTLPLPSAFLRPHRALPASLLRLGKPLRLVPVMRWRCCLPFASLPTPHSGPVPPPLATHWPPTWHTHLRHLAPSLFLQIPLGDVVLHVPLLVEHTHSGKNAEVRHRKKG